MRYLVGIDNGSQSTKVTIFDERGGVHGSGREPLRPTESPRPGAVEHPDDDLWTSVGAACRQAMAGFDGDPSAIAGVGLCAIRFCRALLRADGTLAHPVMSWMDTRVSTSYTHVDDAVRYVTTSSGYLSHRLTGRFRDTAANYRGVWPVDTGRWQWSTDERTIADAGIPRSMLFDLVLPGAVLGYLTEEAARHTGLPQGLPVVATANDKAVEALGSGLREPESVLLSLGTYIAGMTTGDVDIADARGFWTNFASVPYEYLYESGGIRRGMWTVSWLASLLGDTGEEPGRVLDRLNAGAADVPPGSDGLMTVLDWLAPTEAPYRRGAMLGFDARHGPYHIYRSVLEGIALTLHDRVGTMQDDLGAAFRRVTVSGGGARSDLMMRIVADVFGLPATRMTHNDAAGLGAAICAGTGLGIFATVDDAVEAMVKVDRTFDPDAADHERYLAEQDVYRDITRHTDAIFTRSTQVFG